MHVDWVLPVPFVPNVDRMFTVMAATPDRLGYVGYYFRAEGPYQGFLVIVDLNAKKVLALRRGGEVPLWSDVGAIQERTLVFTGPNSRGQLHTCVLGLSNILAFLASKGIAPMWFDLDLFLLPGRNIIPVVLPDIHEGKE